MGGWYEDFRSPEYWIPDLMTQTRQSLTKHGRKMDIWFTEVGAPTHGNTPLTLIGRKEHPISRYGGPADDLKQTRYFFGYDRNTWTTGVSREKGVSYVAKTFALAAQFGVSKIQWYQYRDRGGSRTDPEAFSRFSQADVCFPGDTDSVATRQDSGWSKTNK